MLTVYDVHLELEANADVVDVAKLRDHFKALSINVIGLDRCDIKLRTDELIFSIYGDVGPFMMKQMIRECTQKVFPGSVIGSMNCR